MTLFGALIISALLAFSLSSIPFGYIFAKYLASGLDLQKEGSGNIGFTNAIRVAGLRVGVLTLIADIAKGLISVLIARLLIGSSLGYEGLSFGLASKESVYISLVFAISVIAHCYTPFLKGKGGKGIATGLGCGLACMPLGILLDLCIFLLIALVSKKVSLGSLAAAVGLSLFALMYTQDLIVLVPLACVSLVVIWRHKSNIKNLLAGTEKSFSIAKKD